MNVEIGTEAAQVPEKEYINGIFVAVHSSRPTVKKKKSGIGHKYLYELLKKYILTCRKETMNAGHCLYILYSCRTKSPVMDRIYL